MERYIQTENKNIIKILGHKPTQKRNYVPGILIGPVSYQHVFMIKIIFDSLTHQREPLDIFKKKFISIWYFA